MGGTRRTKKTYDNPAKRWDRTRIEEEKIIKKTFGLKNKREYRILQQFVRKKRQNAKNLLAMPLELRLIREKELIESLAKFKILPENATLDDVLSLEPQEILEKRLQTVVWRKNLAKTPLQARQFIVHGHIAIQGQKNTSPNYLVPAVEIEKIEYFRGRKMILEPPKPESKTSLKKEFEDAAKEENKEPVEKSKQPGQKEGKKKSIEKATTDKVENKSEPKKIKGDSNDK